jgi:hypothetical protein
MSGNGCGVKNIEKSMQCKRMIYKQKYYSWRSYISTLTAETPIKEVWDKIRNIKGSYNKQTYPIVQNNVMLTSNKEKTNAMAKHFQEISHCGVPNIFINLENLLEHQYKDN